MKFVSAATAKEMVKEYESTARQRFLNSLNDKIIECAKKGLTECCISLRECSEQERGNIISFLIQQGFYCIPRKGAGPAVDYYKIMW